VEVLLLALLGACGDEPAPEPTPTTPPATTVWRLDALVSTDVELQARYPTFPGGAELLGVDCASARDAIGERPPPCTAEHWVAITGDSDAAPLTHLRVGEHSQLLDIAPRRKQGWSLLGATLGPCLGDPLALPPAGDPDGLRLLQRDEDGLWWVLRLWGDNPCKLDGAVRLPVTGERVDTSALSVDDHPWSEDGHRIAEGHRRAWRRLLVRERWHELAPADKILALQGLAEDPDPEAASLLQTIIERDPSANADAERALERRRAAFPEDSP